MAWAAALGDRAVHAPRCDTSILPPASPSKLAGGTRMTKQKQPVCGGMKVRTYEVLLRAVEEGVANGWRRAHKHTDTPDEEAVKDQIINAVLSEVGEWFDFNDEKALLF